MDAMPVKSSLQQIPLTQPKCLQTLTENRRIFNLQHCELNVFESYEPTYNVPLTFEDFVITSMVRAKRSCTSPINQPSNTFPANR